MVEVRRDSSQIKEKERRREGKPQMGKTGGRPSFYNNGDQRGKSVMDKATACCAGDPGSIPANGRAAC